MRIIYIAALFALASCSSTGRSPEELRPPLAAAGEQARKHNADNFFAFHYKDDGIYVGNNVEMLTKLSLGNGYAPVLSPDGNMLAYTEPDSAASTIHLYNISAGTSQALNFGPFPSMSGDFGENGRMLAYTIRNQKNISNVCLYDTQNRTTEVLSAERNSSGDYRPTFSPDGQRLLFHNMRNVMVFKVENFTARHMVDIPCENFCQRNALAITPSSKFQMTADHGSIVFACEDYSAGMRDFQRLFIYDIPTSRVREILSPEYSCGDFQVSDDGHIYYIQISPDGSRFLYMAALGDLKPVRVSSEKLGNFPTLSLAY